MVDLLPAAVQDRYNKLIKVGIPYKVALELAWAPKLGADGKLSADVLGSGTYVHGEVQQPNGTVDQTKKVVVVLDANGEIDDLLIVTVA